MSTKQLKVLVTGCVTQQLFWRVNFLWWFAWTLWPPSRFRVRHDTQILQRICGWTNLNWWYETCGKIKRTLGNHCNNCIKALRFRFRGEWYQRLGFKEYISLLMLLVQMDKWLPKNDRKWCNYCIHVANARKSGPLHILDWGVCPMHSFQQHVERRCAYGGILWG